MRTDLFRIALLFLYLIPLTPLGGCKKAESLGVRECDSLFRAARGDSDGKAAVNLVSKESLAHYDHIVELARTAKEKQIRSLRPSEQFDVIYARLLFDGAALKDMTGRDFLVNVINMGKPRPEDLDYELGKISVVGDWAKAEVKFRDDPDLKITFDFSKEDGVWKFDERSTRDRNDRRFERIAADNKISPDKIVQYIIERRMQRYIPGDLWDAPR